MAGLKIRDVHKTFGSNIEVLKGVNLEVESGQFLILVGSSGCGKSTLLNMIAGLETITKGEIEIGGRVVNDLPPKSRDIAMVFQSYALYPSMTVRENISFGLQVRKVSRAEQDRIVARVAEMLQISALLDRKPRQLSGGQRQRVAMGRALARDPQLFLFDEPLSNLDAQLRLEMRAEIKLMHRNLGKTICYVTHDQIEAMTLGDRIAIMKDGLVQQFGTPQELYDTPRTMYVAGFIGSPPMNFVTGKLVPLGAGTGFECDTGLSRAQLPLPFELTQLGSYVGRDVTIGIRPERITDGHDAQRAGAFPPQRLEVVADFVEPTGPDTMISTRLNGARVVCRVHPGVVPDAQSRLHVSLDLSKAVLFDPATGERIAAASQAVARSTPKAAQG
jgi:multiple sugar transport system ATP-binding protein